MSTPTFSLKNLKDKASTLFSPPVSTPNPSMVGTPSGADGGVARMPSSSADAVQEGTSKPSTSRKVILRVEK